MSDFNMPKNNSYLNSKKIKVKTAAESAIADYNNLINDKTHEDNQGQAYKNNEMSILNRLLVAADELDSKNPGEGIFSLIVLALRTNIKLKNKIIDLEMKVKSLKTELKRKS